MQKSCRTCSYRLLCDMDVSKGEICSNYKEGAEGRATIRFSKKFVRTFSERWNQARERLGVTDHEI